MSERCPFCGEMIVWAKNRKTGKLVPIETKHVVYDLQFRDNGSATADPIQPYTGHYGTNHLASCPDHSRLAAEIERRNG